MPASRMRNGRDIGSAHDMPTPRVALDMLLRIDDAMGRRRRVA